MKQQEMTERNKIAWDANAYKAWINRHGQPEKAASVIRANPAYPLRRVLDFIGNPVGLRIANPLGSHGRLAIALALLKAEVTVFDLSESNARYGLEVAACAGVEYLAGDFQRTAPNRKQQNDLVVMDLGIVHYFIDINAFVSAVRLLLKPSGRLVFNEFHSLLKKSVSLESGDAVVDADYFTENCEEAATPYGIFITEELTACLIRRWNLGEIVTAFASGYFNIEKFVEHSSAEFPYFPGTITLVANTA